MLRRLCADVLPREILADSYLCSCRGFVSLFLRRVFVLCDIPLVYFVIFWWFFLIVVPGTRQPFVTIYLLVRYARPPLPGFDVTNSFFLFLSKQLFGLTLPLILVYDALRENTETHGVSWAKQKLAVIYFAPCLRSAQRTINLRDS